MKCQHLIRLAFAVLFAATVSGRAAVVQSPEQLLPSDTLAVVSVPDFDHLRQVTLSSPWGLFWQDAEMKPFREKFLHRWQTNVVEPLERELGVKFQEYIGLMHGQVTLAITRNGWDGTTNQSPAWLVLLDVKDNTNALTGQLAALRKKWVDAGKSLKTEKIRDIEFLNLLFAPNDLKKAMENAFPGLKEEKSTKDSPDKPGEKTGLYVGQSGSLLLLGSSTKDLEKVLVRQAGGLVPMLAAEPVFESCQPQLRGSTLLGWVNLQVILENVRRQLIAASAANPPKDPMAPRPEKVLSAAGLDGLKAAIFSFKETADGYFWEGTLRVPEASRKGLLRMLALETAEAQPAAFVPVDAVKFYRSRLDVQKAWAAIETALA
ncbi:MAG TPA: hypothetical protein PK256_24770, partial [Verrucomicrobiota bacterium]|nr:hypothetical protein [Verrucomicrobiota bacterium]